MIQYRRQGSYVLFLRVCLSVCLSVCLCFFSVSRIAQNVVPKMLMLSFGGTGNVGIMWIASDSLMDIDDELGHHSDRPTSYRNHNKNFYYCGIRKLWEFCWLLKKLSTSSCEFSLRSDWNVSLTINESIFVLLRIKIGIRNVYRNSCHCGIGAVVGIAAWGA